MVALGTLNILELAMAVLGVISAIVSAVEAPGNGAEKKSEAIARAQQVVAELPLPRWAGAIFGNSTVLGVLIDLLVGAANRTGLFSKDAAGSAAAPVAASVQ